ncbi:hypothetical protein PENTCL1PPCAC_13143 [Pristionchus entomophagus]|uniref:Uncharacterized protein n=1 Tax=Pristionchus entomophagus TaxID=358040 RepID=A0AAV5TA50_9BILA|nr:hypothetical protein PENTCL1PPCAC_13143 [Pristionchus entomophagus]
MQMLLLSVHLKDLILERLQFVLFSDQEFSMNRDVISGEQEVLNSVLDDLDVELIRHRQIDCRILDCLLLLLLSTILSLWWAPLRLRTSS